MPKGRPREFDTEQALDRAMDVFWRKGFEGATLPDLTSAMGINRPSLYAAFGNKESLFRKAVDRYAEGPAGYLQEAVQAESVDEAVRKILEGCVRLLSDPKNPRGCLAVQGALACGDEGEAVREGLVAWRQAAEATIHARLERGQEEGELPADARPAELAKRIAVVLFGMAVQAAGGASRNDLRRVAEWAERTWRD